MSLRVVVAPSGFKESLTAEEAADCIEVGVLRVYPDAEVHKVPVVDGGEGTTQTLVNVTGGTLYETTITGPVGQPVESYYGILGGDGPRTAIVELAAAAGLGLVPRDQRNPQKSTTYGVGELIKNALEHEPERILVGCGDSGTNDGGMGMAQALGVHFYDANGKELGYGGAELARLERIDMSERWSALDSVQIDVALNWHNVLCGPNGVARVFGPQKGASPEQVEEMASVLDKFADIVERDTGADVREINGGGASGGTGAGLHAFLGATLYPRFEIIMQYLQIDEPLNEADLVITAEGGIDFQTPHGKVPAEVARRAKRHSLPVLALAGTVGKGAEDNYAVGIDAFTSILSAPCSLEEAIQNGATLLTDSTERCLRMIRMGAQLPTT